MTPLLDHATSALLFVLALAVFREDVGLLGTAGSIVSLLASVLATCVLLRISAARGSPRLPWCCACREMQRREHVHIGDPDKPRRMELNYAVRARRLRALVAWLPHTRALRFWTRRTRTWRTTLTHFCIEL
jgi:hypothetical protein